ncbi:acyltransferase, partial [Oligoflexia bacterium]|nr:acyltransferase [Oligoflexia bacterium]
RNVIARLGLHAGKLGQIALAQKTQVGDGVILDCWGGKIELGENVYLGPYSVLYGHGGISIGQDTLVAMNCAIISANHTIPGKDQHIRWQADQRLPIIIGKDVWLGSGAQVLAGVSIGDGCIVGAGAVVTKDLPPYSIAVGTPAKVIKMRT